MANSIVTEARRNATTWIILVLIIVLNTFFSENGLAYSYILIAGFSVFKFFMVLHQFVEVKQAHVVWKLVSLLFAAVYFIGILVLY
ncbi:MAG: hypothetical protein CL840_19055 [Crocinitomicaceae bacterium]|nr:hypothetical protein [Crocinitomicaceae bacterium]|tara:strand:- start:10444 stop:10701 length:258 start_codon:yes stop_codon:yes gene_type:complete